MIFFVMFQFQPELQTFLFIAIQFVTEPLLIGLFGGIRDLYDYFGLYICFILFVLWIPTMISKNGKNQGVWFYYTIVFIGLFLFELFVFVPSINIIVNLLKNGQMTKIDGYLIVKSYFYIWFQTILFIDPRNPGFIKVVVQYLKKED